MNTFPELQRAVREALAVLLQFAAALAQVREGNVPQAEQALAGVGQGASVNRETRRYADEALYWRARLAESQPGIEARRAAARDYVVLLRRLPEGRMWREVRMRLAVLAEPGKFLTPEEARAASRGNLERIGRALHDYAADHAGRLPGALEDLLDEYVTDAERLVRPGAGEDGGGRVYAYRAGLRAELGVTTDELGAKVALAGGVPVVVWEAVAAGGARLVLRLDGEVMSVQESGGPAAKGKPGRAAGDEPPGASPEKQE